MENISNRACRDYLAKPNKRGCYRGFIAEAGENQFRACNTHPKEFCTVAIEVQLDFQRFHDGLGLSFGFWVPGVPMLPPKRWHFCNHVWAAGVGTPWFENVRSDC